MPARKPNFRVDLRAVVYRDDGFWLAHCLELDIVAEGKTRKEAMESLVSLCETQVDAAMEEDDVSSIFRPAPPQYLKLFFSGADKPTIKLKSRLPVERFEAREAVLA